MGKLIEKLVEDNLLEPKSLNFLLDCMSFCKTGLNRIRGELPQNTFVAQKTGTLGGIVNDAGMIRLPKSPQQLLLVINIDDATMPLEAKESIIGKISKRFYDEALALS